MVALPFVFVEWTEPTSNGVGVNNPVNHNTFTKLGSATKVMTYTFTSGGINSTCSFNVVVNDDANTVPVISGCPVDTVNSFTTSPTCNDAEEGVLAVNCNPPAGSTFQEGTITAVSCVCSDNLGLSDVCTISVFVAANTKPVLSNCLVNTANSFTTSPTCYDAEEGILAVNCNPPAGSTFQPGTITDVSCVCSDNLGLSDFCTFKVFVAANTEPVLSGCPVDTVNSFTTSPTCNDAEEGVLTVNCNPPAGSTFQEETIIVVCFCSDNLGLSDVCTFSVFGAANTKPVLSGCPVDTVNSFTTSPTCNDAEEGLLAVNCNPPAGSTFQEGTITAVLCVCSDNLGLSDVCTFNVFVAANTEPVLSGCPVDTVNSFATPPTCNDAEEGILAVNCNPPAGSTFQEGTITAVSCVCSDNLGLSDVCTFSVFEAANTEPVLSGCPVDTVNSFATPPTCNDAEEGLLAVNCNPPAGSTFQEGTITAVSCVCSDNLGLSDVCTFSVFEAANTEPVLSGCPVDTVNSFATSPTCYDAEEGVLAVNCNPPAGSTFQEETIIVVCFCSDNLGLSDVCTFSVFGAANTEPVLSGCPVDTVNSFATSPTCNDAEEGVLAVNCNPPAGSTFQEGTITAVSCVCSDNLGLSDVCTFSVFGAANTEPVLSGCPVDTVNSFTTSPTCNDAEEGVLAVNCNPPAGSTFQEGTITAVSCVCSDNLGLSDVCSFSVFEAANTEPVLSGCPVDTVNSFTTSPTCNDAEEGLLAVNCNPPAGSTFQEGTITAVSCVCSDNLGLSDVCSFSVFEVNLQNLPPVVECRGRDIVETAMVGDSSVFVTLPTCSVTDDSGQAIFVSQTPPSGFFGLGTTTVINIFADADGNQGFGTFTVTVIPEASVEFVVSCPGPVTTISCNDEEVVNWGIPMDFSDLEDTGIKISSTSSPGSEFKAGVTEVTYIFVNNTRFLGSCSFLVTVERNDRSCSTTENGMTTTIIVVLLSSLLAMLLLLIVVVCWKCKRNTNELPATSSSAASQPTDENYTGYYSTASRKSDERSVPDSTQYNKRLYDTNQSGQYYEIAHERNEESITQNTTVM
ncbi:hyalin-like isoform X2 [Apostichopus japonicus]